jgi:hypothetical protein
MTAAPEVTTTDVANFTAGNGTAVLQRHEFTDGIVRQELCLDTGQLTTDGCDSSGDLLQLATVGCRATDALSPAHGGQR